MLTVSVVISLYQSLSLFSVMRYNLKLSKMPSFDNLQKQFMYFFVLKILQYHRILVLPVVLQTSTFEQIKLF